MNDGNSEAVTLYQLIECINQPVKAIIRDLLLCNVWFGSEFADTECILHAQKHKFVIGPTDFQSTIHFTQ